MIVSLSDEALAELIAAADWLIDDDAWAAAEELHVEVDRAIKWLSQAPGIGTPGPEGTRILPIHRFRYSLVYRVSGDSVRVIALAHQGREPEYWRGRG